MGFKKIPSAIWAIGLSAFLINISTSIVFSLSICFMHSVLGIRKDQVALFQAFVDALSQLVKLLSGVWSDFIHRRKIIVLIGFVCITIAKPVMALSTTIFLVMIARMLDRLGNGIQSTPRDALVGDIAPFEIRGRCFGIRQALAVSGSFAGGVFAILLMHLTGNHYQTIFWLAGIPCVLAVIIFSFVTDPLVTKPRSPYKFPVTIKELKKLGTPYWTLMLVVIVFMLSRFGGETPVILRAQEFGIPDKYSSISLIIYNATNSLTSYPVGLLSDYVGRKWVLASGFVAMMLADVLLTSSNSLWMLFGGIALWGMQIGITQSMFISMIADFIPSDLKGTAIGIFYLVNAITIIFAGYLFKTLMVFESMSFAFCTGGFISFAALMLLFFFHKTPQKHV